MDRRPLKGEFHVMRRCSLILTAYLACASIAPGRDIYVDNVGGDDRHTGHAAVSTSAGTGPCRTIARALRAAVRGDQIVLAATGTPYRESITLEGGRRSGYASRPFVIRGNGAILDGSAPVPEDAWEHYRGEIFRFRPRRTSHQQLFVDDVPAERRRATSDGKLPDLKPLQWYMSDRYIYFRPEAGKLPQNHNVTYADQQVGITLYKVERVTIQNLTVQGFQLDGINAHDGVFQSELVNVTARGNGRSGISVGGASRVKMDGCVVGNNGAAQLRTEGWSKTEITRCDLIPNTAPGIVCSGGRVLVDGQPYEPGASPVEDGAP